MNHKATAQELFEVANRIRETRGDAVFIGGTDIKSYLSQYAVESNGAWTLKKSTVKMLYRSRGEEPPQETLDSAAEG